MNADRHKTKGGTIYRFLGERVHVYDYTPRRWYDSDTASFAWSWIAGCGDDPAVENPAASRYYFDEYFEGDDDGLFPQHVTNLLEVKGGTTAASSDARLNSRTYDHRHPRTGA